jgi:L-threonine-O-3-phosphate decarboxylase
MSGMGEFSLPIPETSRNFVSAIASDQRPTHGGNLAWAAEMAGCEASEILDFSASINPLGPPKTAIAAMQAHLRDLRAYPDPSYTTLRQALGALHHRDPAWILPSNGAAELFTWAAYEFSQLSTTYLVTPAFADYRRALKTFGVHWVPCPLSVENDWRSPKIPLPDVPSTPHAGLLLNNPHNPTGQLWQPSDILPLLERFALVVVDEAFMEFLPPQEQPSLDAYIQDYPNLVIVRSLTKFYSLPGLRIGYTIAHPERVQRWQQWRDPWSVNRLAEVAAIASLQDSNFQQQTWDWLPVARQQLMEGLRALEGFYPLSGAANFLLVHTDIPSSRLQQALLQQHRILIRDCLSFPELGDRFFRVAVRTVAENQQLLDGLRQVVQATQ